MNSNLCNFGVIKKNIQSCILVRFNSSDPFYGLKELILSCGNIPVAAAEHL